MTLGELEAGALFQFQRGGTPSIYQALGDGRYRLAGRYVAGMPKMMPGADVVYPASYPNRKVRLVVIQEEEGST